MWKKKEKIRKGKNNNKAIIVELFKLLGSFLAIFVLLSVRCTQEQKPEENNLSGMIYGQKVVLGVKEKRLETARVGCSGGGGGGGSGGGSSNSSPGGNNSEQPGKGYVLLKVSNANSNSGVENAVVYVNGVQVATTSQEGTAFFPLNPDNYIIKVSAPGFADSFFSVSVQSGSVSVLNFSLVPYRFSFEFNTSQGAQAYDRASGVKIVIPAGALQKESGGAYNGKVYLKLSYIDPQDPLQMKGFPGDFVAQKSNGEKVLLETFGPIEVKLLSESGEKLNLPSGVVAEVSFPIPANMIDYVPDIVPLWSFDERKAEWVEEGILYKVLDEDGRYVLKGYVSHFSWWNPDVPLETTCVKGRIKDEKGNPLVGVPVRSEGVDYFGRDWGRRTDSEGKFFVFVKKNAKSKIKIVLADGEEIEVGEVQTTSSYPSYYLKDWWQNPQGAWSICPDIGEFSLDKLTIILRWGNKNCDLDLHITGPKAGGGRFHIATKVWGRKYGSSSEILGDDYPEIANLILGTQGIYRVSVYHNNPNDTSCGRLLKDSGAVIQVWKGNRVIATASPPSTGSGNIWKALDIQVGADGVVIMPVFEIVSGDYCSPYHPEPSYEGPCPPNSPPTFSADVPSQVEGSGVVTIPLNISDPDGDSFEVKVLAIGNFGRFYTGTGYIVWETPDVRTDTAVNFTIRVADDRGGIASVSYSVVVRPPNFYNVWELIVPDDSSCYFYDVALATDGFYTIQSINQGERVVKLDQGGRISNTTSIFPRVFDVEVGSDGVYVAKDIGSGVFVLSKNSFDISSTLWEIVTTTNGKFFMSIDTFGDNIYVVFVEGGNYVIKKYSSSGSLIWELSFPPLINVSNWSVCCRSICNRECLRVNKDTGDVYFEAYEDKYGGYYAHKVFRISPSGSILYSMPIEPSWGSGVIYPSGTSIYLAVPRRLCSNNTCEVSYFLEVYDQNFNLIKSVKICSTYPFLCSPFGYPLYWIWDIFVSGGKLYASASRSINKPNGSWLKDSIALLQFTLNLDLIEVNNIGLSYKNIPNNENISEYEFGFGVVGNLVYMVGYIEGNSYIACYPFALKLKYTR
jgi:hypothetical protein